jgi:hypothetical protein
MGELCNTGNDNSSNESVLATAYTNTVLITGGIQIFTQNFSLKDRKKRT